MKAITVDALGASASVRDDLPAPAPADDGVLVRVHASSANPVDNAIAAGMLSGNLRGLGVSELIDRDADIAGAVRERHPDGIDALLDVVSYTPDAFDVHAAALRDGGRAASSNGAAGDAPGRTSVMAVPSPENLERLAELLDAGTLKVPIQDTYDLDRAGEALQALGTAHTQGKHAIRVA